MAQEQKRKNKTKAVVKRKTEKAETRRTEKR